MSALLFNVVEHTTPCQHIREYPRGTRLRQEDVLHLAIKQYTPLNNLQPKEGDITIIVTHANGFPKESYEPLLDDLLKSSKEHGFEIRNIWAADMSNQGASGVLNERVQGDDHSWFDHSRDLLFMINQFREHMPRPIVGIGHSLGAAELVGLSIMHPRLFTTLVLMEPMIQREAPEGPSAVMLSSYRPDLWPSLAAAEAGFRKNKFFASWDRRALENLLKYGLRRIPTAVYPISPAAKDGSVTLTTTKHQEAWSYFRPNFEPRQPREGQDLKIERLLSPDLDPERGGTHLFHRAEPGIALEYLPYLRPSVLYLFGAESPMSTMELQAQKMDRTGMGLGGSGGAKQGQVEKRTFEKRGHMLPCEEVERCAEHIAEWLGRRMRHFRADEKFLRDHPSGKSDRDMLVLSKQWMKSVRGPVTATRPFKEKL